MSLKTTISGTVEGVGIALESIRANKVRAGLTILGVSVGVFVVVAIGAMITGINNAVTKDLAAAGPTTFFVSRAPISLRRSGGMRELIAATLMPAWVWLDSRKAQPTPLVSSVRKSVISANPFWRAARTMRSSRSCEMPVRV